MIDIEKLANQVIEGKNITREQAMELYNSPLDKLCDKANEIRQHFCSNSFDLCTIINAKSGKCTENCRFCAQSAFHHTGIKEYPLVSTQTMLEQAKINEEQGILRYSIVTSGKRLSDEEVEKVCEAIKEIKKQTKISVCVSLGLLNKEQYLKLRQAGACRVHNNLETSRSNFKNVCTTHSFDEKIAAIRAAQDAGLSVCSGGIMGLSETPEDRIDMAFTLRELGIKSVPINMLIAIPGTPLEHNKMLTTEEMRRIVAVYRFILPDAAIRLAGGRGYLDDKGESCFRSGANAAITGDMLTTVGITAQTDKRLLASLGYVEKRDHE